MKEEERKKREGNNERENKFTIVCAEVAIELQQRGGELSVGELPNGLRGGGEMKRGVRGCVLMCVCISGSLSAATMHQRFFFPTWIAPASGL
jgi:hypothetical protein